MTDDEVTPFLGKPIRATLADGKIFAGVLERDSAHSHGHAHYVISSSPLRSGQGDVHEVIHGAELFTDIEDAADDLAAKLN